MARGVVFLGSSVRFARGGSWNSGPGELAAADRSNLYMSNDGYSHIGFRLKCRRPRTSDNTVRHCRIANSLHPSPQIGPPQPRLTSSDGSGRLLIRPFWLTLLPLWQVFSREGGWGQIAMDRNLLEGSIVLFALVVLAIAMDRLGSHKDIRRDHSEKVPIVRSSPLPFHFSLRTLLVAMTVVAILLGLIVYAVGN